MKRKLPAPLEAYFDAVNRGDVDGMLEPFAAHAVVKDEGTGLVSGTFPGSPVRLRYAFKLHASEIIHLEIS